MRLGLLVLLGGCLAAAQWHESMGSEGVDAHRGPEPWRMELARETDARLKYQVTRRLDALLEKTVTPDCAEEVALSYEAFMTAHATETLLPFEQPFVQDQCPPQHQNYTPFHVAAADLRLLYVILAHGGGAQVVRLIRALQDGDLVNFVVHMDGKGPLPPELVEYAGRTSNVYLMKEGRVNVTWGGFSVVQATLNAIQYAFFLSLRFDRVINLSGTTYPLTTPLQIRETLAQHPLQEQLMFIDPKPNVPSPYAWHYFVECDNRLHRIARVLPPHGIKLRTGSQWFIISREFALFLLEDQTFVAPYSAYAQHIIVADENFFATVLMASPFCHFLSNRNYLYLWFDKWEDEKAESDPAKCLQPDPKYCGRSPLALTTEDVPRVMSGENGTFLWARKFTGPGAGAAMDEVDRRLNRTVESCAVEEAAPSQQLYEHILRLESLTW